MSEKDFDITAEFALYRRAMRQRWDIPPETKNRILKRLNGILAQPDGDDKVLLEAINTYVKMDQLNLQQEKQDAATVRVSPKDMPDKDLMDNLQKIFGENEELRERLLK